jgi:hypothetical protein
MPVYDRRVSPRSSVVYTIPDIYYTTPPSSALYTILLPPILSLYHSFTSTALRTTGHMARIKLNAVRSIQQVQEKVVQGTGVGATHAVSGMSQEEATEKYQDAFALTIDSTTDAIGTVNSAAYRQIQQDSPTAAVTAATVTAAAAAAATATASNPLLLLAATPAAVPPAAVLPAADLSAAVPPAAVSPGAVPPGAAQDSSSSVELSSVELSPHVHAVPGTSKYLV